MSEALLHARIVPERLRARASNQRIGDETDDGCSGAGRAVHAVTVTQFSRRAAGSKSARRRSCQGTSRASHAPSRVTCRFVSSSCVASAPQSEARRTSSAALWTCSLPLMWLRWVSTVLTLMPSLTATCLFVWPQMIRSKISRSRVDSRSRTAARARAGRVAARGGGLEHLAAGRWACPRARRGAPPGSRETAGS